MIPREMLKKIRQSELCTNRIVIAAGAERGCARIPTGFCPKAQGCEASAFVRLRRDERATLGQRRPKFANRKAVATIPFPSAACGICHNPVGVADDLIPFTQGSACVATLGCKPESRLDSLTAPLGRPKSAIGNQQSIISS